MAAAGGGGGGGGGEAGDWDAWVLGLGPLLKEHDSTATAMQLISAIIHIRAAPLMKMVLLLGMHSPLVFRRWPSIFMMKVEVRAQRRL